MHKYINNSGKCGSCDKRLAPGGYEFLCSTCEIVHEAKGRAMARGALEVLGPLLERLQSPVTDMPAYTMPTAEYGQRIREALEAAKKTYGGETP